MERIREQNAWHVNGFLVLVIQLFLFLGAFVSFATLNTGMGVILLVLAFPLFSGYVIIQPNESLENKGFELDDEKKAAMVNNLLVALVSEGNVNPVINTGTLYQ